MDILKSATDWAKAELISTPFFILFGLLFMVVYVIWVNDDFSLDNLIYVGSTIPILQDITSGAGTPDPRYVNVKVLTVNNQDITFHNFKVGEYLPVQCKRIFATGTTAGVDCIAMS